MQIEYAIKDIEAVAARIWQYAGSRKAWLFYGAMGSGKTTLIKAICRQVQVKDAISSPTFSLINEYVAEQAGKIYHMDLYRLKDEEEALQAGVEECILSGAYCFIEWPEKAPGLLPAEFAKIHLVVLAADRRQLVVEIQ